MSASLFSKHRIRRRVRARRGPSRAGDNGQTLLRGLEQVYREWLPICTVPNLVKFFQFGSRLTTSLRHYHPMQSKRYPVGVRTTGI